MSKRIAFLIDSDQWSATAVHAGMLHAAKHGTVRAYAFGAFMRAPLDAWAAHYEELGVPCVDASGRNKADDALVAKARSIAESGGADAIWIATQDRGLLERVAAIGCQLELRAVRDPEAERLPPGMSWEKPEIARPPLPDAVVHQLREVLRSKMRKTGSAYFADVAAAMPDGSALARRHGRETLLDLFLSVPGVSVERAEGQSSVLLRQAPIHA